MLSCDFINSVLIECSEPTDLNTYFNAILHEVHSIDAPLIAFTDPKLTE